MSIKVIGGSQGQMDKTSYFSQLLLCVLACIPLKNMLKGHMKVKIIIHKEIDIFVCCEFFCDLCVRRMVRLRLKGILVANNVKMTSWVRKKNKPNIS